MRGNMIQSSGLIYYIPNGILYLNKRSIILKYFIDKDNRNNNYEGNNK